MYPMLCRSANARASSVETVRIETKSHLLPIYIEKSTWKLRSESAYPWRSRSKSHWSIAGGYQMTVCRWHQIRWFLLCFPGNIWSSQDFGISTLPPWLCTSLVPLSLIISKFELPVSHSCVLIILFPLWTDLEKKSTPIVEEVSSWKTSKTNRVRILVFPTPESPTITTNSLLGKRQITLEKIIILVHTKQLFQNNSK